MKIHPASVVWPMGVNNEAHYYSSLQLAYAFKTHAKYTKIHKNLNWLSLLRFSLLLSNCEGSHFALIYKFKDVNFNDMHTPMKDPYLLKRVCRYCWNGVVFIDTCLVVNCGHKFQIVFINLPVRTCHRQPWYAFPASDDAEFNPSWIDGAWKFGRPIILAHLRWRC